MINENEEIKNTNITSALKDKGLELLVKELTPESCFLVNISPIMQELDIDFDTLDILLTTYRENDFIKEGYPRRSCESFSLLLKQKAVDFLNSGGYQKEKYLSLLSEQKLHLEIDKLQLEISELQKQFPDNPVIERVISIASNIATILSFGMGK